MRGWKLMIGLLLIWAGVALAQEAAQQEAGAVTVQTASSDTFGDYLTDGEGMSLYLFTNDTAATADAPAVSACADACLMNWPPLLVTGEATAGEGAMADLLGTLTRDDGTTQVTYNGWPLYYFANDAASGDTAGQEVGDVWYLVSPAGEAIEQEAAN
jgi:predicted lipoprotein with Yx(FWY)xxD motif